MGKYINQTSKCVIGPSFDQKCEALLEDGAILIAKPDKFMNNLVCVINNGIFGAAGYAYNEREFEVFTDPSDPRQRRWFIWDKVTDFT